MSASVVHVDRHERYYVREGAVSGHPTYDRLIRPLWMVLAVPGTDGIPTDDMPWVVVDGGVSGELHLAEPRYVRAGHDMTLRHAYYAVALVSLSHLSVPGVCYGSCLSVHRVATHPLCSGGVTGTVWQGDIAHLEGPAVRAAWALPAWSAATAGLPATAGPPAAPPADTRGTDPGF